MENEKETIMVEIDGVQKEAEVINVITVDDKRYIFYSVDLGDGTADVYASELIKDEEGYDKMIDIEDEEIRKNVFELANTMLSEDE